MPTDENIYCAQQIDIPVTLPFIIKQYAKAAIRTQPYDLLTWTAAYFRALANGQEPPVKKRLEYPPFEHPSGMTPGYLKTLLHQLGRQRSATLDAVLSHWSGIGVNGLTLYQILMIGRFLDVGSVDVNRFLAIACGYLGNSLRESMIYVCELLTEEPEGGSAMIPFAVFSSLYRFLACLHCDGKTPRDIIVKSQTDLTSNIDDLSGGTSDDLCKCGLSLSTLCRKDSNPSAIEPSVEDRISEYERFEGTDSSQDFTHQSYEFDSDDNYEAMARRKRERSYDSSVKLIVSSASTCHCMDKPESIGYPTFDLSEKMMNFVEKSRLDYPDPFIMPRLNGIGSRVSERCVDAVLEWLSDCASRQSNLVGPRNIRHFLCPPLSERPPTCCDYYNDCSDEK